MKRLALLACFLLLLIYALTGQSSRVETAEIGKNNTALLPGGKEADGIIGDFVLRNDKVHALISGNLPLRRANMSTEYRFVTPGCLYDLDLRGANNDQITVFRPGNLGGELSWVRVVNDGVIEAVRTAAKGDGLYTRHEYRLEPGWQYILVNSTYRNESREAKKIATAPAWKQFSREWKVGDVRIGDSIDPFDKRAYAWGPATPMAAEVTLAPGEERTAAVVLAVADSPLAAYGVVATLAEPGSEITGTIRDSNGAPAVQAAFWVDVKEIGRAHV